MEIKVGKSAHVCAACEKNFQHEEEFSSQVLLAEQDLVREDFCSSCWETSRTRAAYSVWTATYYDPKVAEQEPPEVFSPLRQLFYEAIEAEERDEQAKAFLAAQLLRRQKVFRLIKESDEKDGEIRLVLYNDRIGNRLIEVRDPNFSYEELDMARGKLVQRLQELEHPEVTGETALPPEGSDSPGDEVETVTVPELSGEDRNDAETTEE
jgi:hypothetical protein